jgi:hypothetical protein
MAYNITISQFLWISMLVWVHKKTEAPYLLWICAVQDTVVLQLTKELHSQQPVQGHEEQEEQRDIVYLLTRAPNKEKHVISNNKTLCPKERTSQHTGKGHYVS